MNNTEFFIGNVCSTNTQIEEGMSALLMFVRHFESAAKLQHLIFFDQKKIEAMRGCSIVFDGL